MRHSAEERRKGSLAHLPMRHVVVVVIPVVVHYFGEGLDVLQGEDRDADRDKAGGKAANATFILLRLITSKEKNATRDPNRLAQKLKPGDGRKQGTTNRAPPSL
jgi:hypothetical protein